MPSPEGGPNPGHPDHQPSPESESIPYLRVARFADAPSAGAAYSDAQDAIYAEPHCDVSVYRLRLDDAWHVAALGEPPPRRLARTLDRLLARGEPTSLPDEVLAHLTERRARATRMAPWVEGHYPVPPDRA